MAGAVDPGGEHGVEDRHHRDLAQACLIAARLTTPDRESARGALIFYLSIVLAS
jgi:hypothetical protein